MRAVALLLALFAGVVTALAAGAGAQTPCVPPVCTPTTSTAPPETQPETQTQTQPRPTAPVETVAPHEGSAGPYVTFANNEHVEDAELVAPFVRRWVVKLPASVAAPPVHEAGRIHVAVGGTRGEVVTVDAATGARLWTAPAPSASGIVVEGGRVFVSGIDRLAALSAADGRVLWSVDFSAPPGHSNPAKVSTAVVGGSVVYALGRGRSAAIAVEDGRVLWEGYGGSGDDVTLALGPGRLVMSFTCGGVVAFSRSDGTDSWRGGGDCSSFATVAGDRVYVAGHERGFVLDEASGNGLGSFPRGQTIVARGVQLVNFRGSLVARDVAT
ncbi:MAG TPA: PQQ-binding-like beta-propeller repeat protein, partial [Solirubrobacteraceae bacterium]|nr:PQQ-binding-like beta-propeller repeat protein [Solirubrobacteraceae bacterium]